MEQRRRFLPALSMVNNRGQPLTISDANGIESELEYDERGR